MIDFYNILLALMLYYISMQIVNNKLNFKVIWTVLSIIGICIFLILSILEVNIPYFNRESFYLLLFVDIFILLFQDVFRFVLENSDSLIGNIGKAKKIIDGLEKINYFKVTKIILLTALTILNIINTIIPRLN